MSSKGIKLLVASGKKQMSSQDQLSRGFSHFPVKGKARHQSNEQMATNMRVCATGFARLRRYVETRNEY